MQFDTYTPSVNEELDTIKINPQIEGSTDEDSIAITRNAFDKIVEFIEANNIPDDFSLRFAAKSGGCSGMVYKLGLDNNYYENDRKYEIEGVRIAIDAKSIFYMMGVTLDYMDDINGSGFVFNSPFNEKTCGCSH